MTKFVRFEVDGRTGYGIVEGNTIRELDKSYFEQFSVTSETFDLDKVRLLSPTEPSKIIGISLSDTSPPDGPSFVAKSTTVAIGPGEPVNYPDLSDRIEYGGELAIVVGKTAHNIEPEDADEYIFGYTCLTDATLRDPEGKEGVGSDTLCPVGPWIVDNVEDPNNLDIELALNDEQRGHSSTSQSALDVQHLLSSASKAMTLNAGDIIATGIPIAIGPVQPGDVMEVKIQNIGCLKNPVKR
ncbi:MAG: fumarylacetoacetate hydrolase family protein [Planctomycetes bacterium]|nr:fumarylacetoacetate hydrolase family protein [Planctomycetota bacterium]